MHELKLMFEFIGPMKAFITNYICIHKKLMNEFIGPMNAFIKN